MKRVNSVGSERVVMCASQPTIAVRNAEPLGRGVEFPLINGDLLGKHLDPNSTNSRAMTPRADGTACFSELEPPPDRHANLLPELIHTNPKKSLCVMKFGGTSVADASCVERVAEIVWAASRTANIVVVVSAMSGVTNKLIEAATSSGAGNRERSLTIFEGLQKRHQEVASALIHSTETRQQISRRLKVLFREGIHLCESTIARRELTPRICDAISGLGERLSAPLVAAVLSERGLASKAIEATELIVTDSCHGAADPNMDLTRDRCEARLRPLLLRGIIPVVTGFIGADLEGVLTTLGRNSSDHSSTIVGAALNADDVTIWTDVDGILNGDPKLVPDAHSIPEMSYYEACGFADSGAKVLHPKALRTAMQYRIPLTIRNTFAPGRPGTRITLEGPSRTAKAKSEVSAPDEPHP